MAVDLLDVELVVGVEPPAEAVGEPDDEAVALGTAVATGVDEAASHGPIADWASPYRMAQIARARLATGLGRAHRA